MAPEGNARSPTRASRIFVPEFDQRGRRWRTMVPVAALGLTGSANEKANCGIDIVRTKLFLSDYAVKRPNFCRPPMVPTGEHLFPLILSFRLFRHRL